MKVRFWVYLVYIVFSAVLLFYAGSLKPILPERTASGQLIVNPETPSNFVVFMVTYPIMLGFMGLIWVLEPDVKVKAKRKRRG